MHPSASAAVQRPSLVLLGAEPFRAAFESARHRLVKASPSRPGDGHPVVIVPGLGADGSSVVTLHDHCRALGQTCRHRQRSTLVHDIEIDGSHIGMGWNRQVLDAVTDRLGQGAGPWRQYVQAA